MSLKSRLRAELKVLRINAPEDEGQLKMHAKVIKVFDDVCEEFQETDMEAKLEWYCKGVIDAIKREGL